PLSSLYSCDGRPLSAATPRVRSRTDVLLYPGRAREARSQGHAVGAALWAWRHARAGAAGLAALYVYFDNADHGYAPQNARRLRAMRGDSALVAPVGQLASE